MRNAVLLSFALICTSGCGAGSESGGYEGVPIVLPTYGAVAVNQVTGRAGITANYSSQKNANDNALEQCGVACIVALEFGSGDCGALARASTTPTFGWARDSKEYDAKVAALNQCTAKNGVGCEIKLVECNK